jgi:uncharacterized protein (TIGR03435 family)
MRHTFGNTAVLIVATFTGVFGQTAEKRPAFEVASVKANLADDPYSDAVPQRSGDRVTMHNIQLRTVIAWAYHLENPSYELVAGPWDKSLYDSYDIQAVAPGSPGEDSLRLMFQTLLEERFGLKVHAETRELPAYDLVVVRGGAKLTPSQPGAKRSMARGGISSWVELTGKGGGLLVGRGASMEELTVILTGKMNAPVRDRTGIAGAFDYNVKFSSGVDESDAPVLTTAIHELGLNPAKTKGLFGVRVIDHLEKVSGN